MIFITVFVELQKGVYITYNMDLFTTYIFISRRKRKQDDC